MIFYQCDILYDYHAVCSLFLQTSCTTVPPQFALIPCYLMYTHPQNLSVQKAIPAPAISFQLYDKILDFSEIQMTILHEEVS